MKYFIYDEPKNIEWSVIYCNSHKEETTYEDIIKSIISENFIGKFNKEEHTSITKSIKNDKRMYITVGEDGNKYIWQIGGLLSDMEGFLIPCAYKVRKIGILFE